MKLPIESHPDAIEDTMPSPALFGAVLSPACGAFQVTNTHDETFRAARWRYTRERTDQWLKPAVNAFLSSWIGLTLPFVLGGLIFGAVHILAEARVYVAGLTAIVIIFAFALLAGIAALSFNYLAAPAAIWRRDQETIAQLHSSLTPALCLTFTPDDCMKNLHRGTFVESAGGERWYNLRGADQHVLVQCTNTCQVRIDEIAVHVVGLELVDAALSAPGFFEPVRISPPSRGETDDMISLPPGGSRFFSVLVQPSLYSKPRINGQFHPLDYEFLFDNSGIYPYPRRSSRSWHDGRSHSNRSTFGKARSG
jgi:Sodium:dicarboxylate symporter family